VIDEAQDLSPLMWAVVDRMFAAAEFRAILGDDDQALYCFSGASPELLNGRQARQIIKLTHSYRLAAPTVRAALALIGRNRNREPKDLYPADHAGETGYAHSLSDLDLLSGETWFLQVRNWALFEQLAQQLEGRGIPYLARGGRRHSPWRSETALRAVRALVRLIDRQPVTLTDVWALTRFGHSERGEKAGIWTWGAKSRISERATREPGASVQWHDLGDLGMTPNGVRTLLSHAPFGVLTRELSDRDLAAYTEAWQRGNLSREARVEVGSCHGFKGAEADRQVTVSGCTGRPYRALYDGERVEEERRVAYVALTRARYGSYVLTPRPAPGVYPWEVMRL
jgi:superfamily I DNA/RNA helicase